MRTAITLMTTVFLSAVAAFDNSNAEIVNDKQISVLEVSTLSAAPQEVIPRTETGRVPTPLTSEPLPSVQEPYVPSNELIVENSFVPIPPQAHGHAYGCGCYTCQCCPPPTIPTTICLVDPCGCEHEVCVHVPACCADQSPSVAWRRGLFGRQIATLCWDCCNKSVRVVVNRWGRVIVWG